MRGDLLAGLRQQYDIFDRVYYISSGKFRRYHGESLVSQLLNVKTLALNVRDFFKVLVGIWQSRKLLRRIKPDVVFSKGGFVVVPVGLAARLQKIPIITHDSDAVPGLANRIVGRWALVHATGMPAKYYPYSPETIHYVGVPASRQLKPVTTQDQIEFKRKIGIAADEQVLLVAGGGLGSQTLNNLVVQIAPELLDRHRSLHIIHITGDAHQKATAERYQKILSSEQQKRLIILGFSNQFSIYSGAADLVIARAGATTLAELAVQRKALIIIPSPFLTAGHQLENAKILESLGAAKVLPNDVGQQAALKTIEDLLANSKKRRLMAQKLGSTARPEALQKLAEIIWEVAKSQAKGNSH